MSAPLRFVIVGAGSIGREFGLRHLSRPQAEYSTTVSAVVDSNLDAARSLASDITAKLGGAKLAGGLGYRETVVPSSSSSSTASASAVTVAASTSLEEVLHLADAVSRWHLLGGDLRFLRQFDGGAAC